MDWSQVLFSDEKIFWGEGYCGRTTCAGQSARRSTLCTLKRKEASGEGECWACFSANGQGFMVRSNSPTVMKQMLIDNLFASARETLRFRARMVLFRGGCAGLADEQECAVHRLPSLFA